MKRRPTRLDVAQRAGVSKTTVTVVLGDRHDIAIPEATRERVRRAAQELGYQPNAIAKALGTGKTNAITVAFPNLFVPHYSRVLRAIESQTAADGYHLIASTLGHANRNTVLSDLWTLMNNPSDAVILVDSGEALKPYFDEMGPFTKPVVVVGIYNTGGVDCVEVDMQSGASAALKHLLDAGPKRLAFFGFGSADEAAGVMLLAERGEGDPRAIAYQKAMEQAGRPTEVIFGSHAGRREKIALLKSYVEQKGCPDAIFCYDDELAVSAHHCLRRMGLRIPYDVLLVGCDGNEECEYLDPPMTTIVQPIEEMCARAWEFTKHRLSEDVLGRQYCKLDADLVIRESSVPGEVAGAGSRFRLAAGFTAMSEKG